MWHFVPEVEILFQANGWGKRSYWHPFATACAQRLVRCFVLLYMVDSVEQARGGESA